MTIYSSNNHSNFLFWYIFDDDFASLLLCYHPQDATKGSIGQLLLTSVNKCGGSAVACNSGCDISIYKCAAMCKKDLSQMNMIIGASILWRRLTYSSLDVQIRIQMRSEVAGFNAVSSSR